MCGTTGPNGYTEKDQKNERELIPPPPDKKQFEKVLKQLQKEAKKKSGDERRGYAKHIIQTGVICACMMLKVKKGLFAAAMHPGL